MKCCVIIPVGPGHQDTSLRAIHSVETAISNGTGAFSSVEVIAQDDTLGQGRSRARNLGVLEAGKREADWVFFMDADELMAPNAFNEVQHLLQDYDAIWGAIYEANLETQQATRRSNDVAPIDSLEQVLLNQPFLTLHNGHFVRYPVALEHPFNTEMDCGEDFEYYLRVWRDSRCIKIVQPIFFNVRGQHSTGPRAATGKDWNEAMPQVFTAFCLQNDVVAHLPLGDAVASLRLSNTLDPVQNLLAREQFAELGELEALLRRLPDNASVLDIGAHLGSFSICLALLGKAAKVETFEKDRILSTLLEYNLRLNNLDESAYRVHRLQIGNPQSLAQSTDAYGRIALDDLIADQSDTSLDSTELGESLDLIRIAAPGKALKVLKGATRTVQQYQPLILARVTPADILELESWLADNRYRQEHAFDHASFSNLLLIPSE